MFSSKSGIAIVLCILVVGCAKKEESATATSAVSPPSPAAGQAASTASTTPAASAPAQQGAPSGVIASTDGEKSGTRVDIIELKRSSGGTVNLKFVLVNNSDKDLNVASSWLGDASLTSDSYRNVSGIHLIDPANKKKYFVITDAEKKCVCSTNVENVDPGQKVSLWAKFPAPPPEVQKVTIEIPHFQPIDDVQIQ